MKRTTLWLLLVALTTAGSFAALIYYSLHQVSPRDIPEAAAEGKKVWEEYNCVECHSVVGNGGYSAPDLTNEVSIRNEKWLKQFFLDPPIIQPGKSTRHVKLDNRETQKMIEYLRFVNRIQNLNWPSPPRKILDKVPKNKESKQD